MSQSFFVHGSNFLSNKWTNRSSYSLTGRYKSARPLTASSAVSTRKINCSADSDVTWGKFMSDSRGTYNRLRLLSYHRLNLSHAIPKLVEVTAMPFKACLARPDLLLMRCYNLIWLGMRSSLITLGVKSSLQSFCIPLNVLIGVLGVGWLAVTWLEVPREQRADDSDLCLKRGCERLQATNDLLSTSISPCSCTHPFFVLGAIHEPKLRVQL